MDSESLTKILQAAEFAAKYHCNHRRKDIEESPYINHPIQVATVLSQAGVTDCDVICAGLLHDTVEDTQASEELIRETFGDSICGLVMEVTDDKTLSKADRKRLQVENASKKSNLAKQLKIADKICNIRDLNLDSPAGWDLDRKLEYLDWGAKVVAGCRGVNERLDQLFDQQWNDAKNRLNAV